MNKKIRLGLLIVLVLSFLLAGSAQATSYSLTVVVQGNGVISTNPVRSTYPSGVTVQLTATPNAGWYFGGWSESAGGLTNEVNLVMTNNLTVDALFLPDPTYSITLTTNGQGSIALSPSGGSYYSNTLVTATATASAGWVFTGWSGATNTTTASIPLAVDSNQALAGNFAQLPAFDVPPQSITNAVGSTVTFVSHSVGTAPVVYQWYFSNEPITGATSDTLTLANAPATEAGFYQVIATNFYGSVTSSVVALVLTNAAQSTNIVSVCDEAALQMAISAGGWISIGCSGTLTITNTLYVTNHVILDGSGVEATLSGGGLVRLFYVEPGASLAITNLTLANGSFNTNNYSPVGGGAIFNNGGAVTLTGCALTNNSAITGNGYPYTANGGAIYNNGGTVELYACSLLNNSAFGEGNSYPQGGFGYGGAIYNTNGNVIINDSSFENNVSKCGSGAPCGSFGGALFQASGNLRVTNTIWSGNQALGDSITLGDQSASPAYGGALATSGGQVSLDLCQFVGNTAQGGNGDGDSMAGPAFGGAVFCSNSLTAVSCSFSANQVLGGKDAYNFAEFQDSPPANGGAIYNLGAMVLDNCLVSSNETLGGTSEAYQDTEVNGGNGLGGGIFNGAQLTATNCTIALNSSVGQPGSYGYYSGTATYGSALGGGVYNSSNAVFLGVNVTIASNICFAGTDSSAPYETSELSGLAAGAQIANTNGTVELLNSLLAYGSTNGNAYGPIIDLGDNISSDNSANFDSGSSFNLTDPLLGPLANNGGPTLTMALAPDSPAIGFADSDDGAPSVDQRGYARPTGDGVIDLGAYQFGATSISSPPPISLTIVKSFPNVVVSFTTSPAITNTLHFQSSTNLINWTDLGTFGAFSSPSNISETISMEGAVHQFFRLMW